MRFRKCSAMAYSSYLYRWFLNVIYFSCPKKILWPLSIPQNEHDKKVALRETAKQTAQQSKGKLSTPATTSADSASASALPNHLQKLQAKPIAEASPNVVGVSTYFFNLPSSRTEGFLYSITVVVFLFNVVGCGILNFCSSSILIYHCALLTW